MPKSAFCQENIHMKFDGEDSRYDQDTTVLAEAMHTILQDDGARAVGTPKWPREDDPELFDAIHHLRNYALRRAGDDEFPFNVGSSFIRHVNSWLWNAGDFEVFNMLATPQERIALTVLDARLKDALKG